MRGISLLLIGAGAALAGCMMAPPGPGQDPETMRSASGQRALDALMTGRVAGTPVNCIPSFNTRDMQVIDGQNVAFRVGTRTVYMAQLSQGCSLLGAGGYSLLTSQFGGTGLCRGQIAQVVDLRNNVTVGSCTIQDIIPYSRPGG
jgi:hypothetical protein